jgi:hypothetical protein
MSSLLKVLCPSSSTGRILPVEHRQDTTFPFLSLLAGRILPGFFVDEEVGAS